MSTVGYRVIYAGPADGTGATHPQTVEGEALSAVQPGAMVSQGSTGIDANSAAATVFGALPLFANKDEVGSNSVDDAWTTGENMIAIQGRSGEFLNVLVASGAALSTAGIPLSSNGNTTAGTLKVAATDGTEEIIAYTDEAPGTLTADTLVRVD